jgi:hypothetical protein
MENTETRKTKISSDASSLELSQAVTLNALPQLTSHWSLKLQGPTLQCGKAGLRKD